MAKVRWDKLTPSEQEALQVARLRDFLKYQVIPYSPHYREVFRSEGINPDQIRSLKDMAQIPFSNKGFVAPTDDEPTRPRNFVLQPTPELLRAHLPFGRKMQLLAKKIIHGADAVKAEIGAEYRPVQVFFTTGRTALPTSFLLSKYDLGVLEEAGRRIGAVAGIDAAVDRVVSMFPYAPHLAFWQVQAVSVATGCFTLQTGGGKVMGTDGILRVLEKMTPTFICGIPGYVYHVVREAVERGVDLSSVNTAFLGGDRIIGGFREKLIELMKEAGCEDPAVISVLGFTEARKCWSECRHGGEEAGLHTYPDLEIFECIDPDSGEILPDGETGEMTYTCLDGRGSVVLRYRTGDILNGGITREPCPGCGRSVPRLSSNLSRVSNLTDFNLTKIKGALVNLTAMADLLNSHANVDEWQVVICKRNDDPFDVDELHLMMSVRAGSNEDEVTTDVANAIFEAMEVRPAKVEIHSRDEILERIGMETRLKENRIVDLRADAVPQKATK